MRRLVYISHPFTGAPERNRIRARDVAAELAARYARFVIAVNPLDLFLGASGNASEEDILSMAVEVMLRCDGVIFCDGWKRSRGCRWEHYMAYKAGLPCWHGLADFHCCMGGEQEPVNDDEMEE